MTVSVLDLTQINHLKNSISYEKHYYWIVTYTLYSDIIKDLINSSEVN